MRKIPLFSFSAIVLMNFVFPGQQHRAGTKGPDTPPLQGQGSWRYLAPLPHARVEVALAEAGGKIYVLGGYAEGFVTGKPEIICPRIGVDLGVGEEFSVSLAMKITNSDGCRACGSN